MEAVVTFLEGPASRFALPLVSRTVRVLVPPETIGAYLLLYRSLPIYVGRSDLCVQTRLATHPLIGVATHFVWEPCRSRIAAFTLESVWFHRLDGAVGVVNMIHPASPEESGVRCPFCHAGDDHALARALAPRSASLFTGEDCLDPGLGKDRVGSSTRK